MRLYKHRHKIVGDKRRLGVFFAEEFEITNNNSNKQEYRASGKLSNKKYLCDLQEGEVNEICTATSRYKLFFCTATLLTIIGLYGRFSQQMFLQNLCLPAGSMHIILYGYSFFRTHDNPAFFHTQSRITELFSSPRLVRAKVSTGTTNIANILLGFVCLQPWLLPIENIFIWIAIPNVAILLLTKIGEEIDPVTNRVLLLAAVTNAIVATGIANIAIHSQQAGFIEQEKTILSVVNSLQLGSPELQTTLLQTYTNFITDPMNISILWNIFVLFVVFAAGRSMFVDSLNPSTITTSPPMFGDNTYIRYGISMMLLLNISLFFVLPLSQLLDYSVGPELSMVQFAVYYTPGLLIMVSWGVFSIYSIIKNRWTLLALRDSGTIDTTRQGTDLIVTDLDKQRAVAVDLFGKKEFILIDSQLYNSLDSRQIDTIYHHERYHIQQGSQVCQILSQIPLIGYVFALFLINPADIYEREIKADKRAAKRVNPTIVQKTIEEVEQKTTPRVPQTNEGQRKSQWWQFIKILWKIPLYSMYRPPKEHRITRLEEFNEKNSQNE
ncbi:hypothetical protein PM022_13485 [Halorubrum ezzemoulense]|uniref:hypothetical protein n=1 Tax=Halorubrum ezzemoulense TaxID=337243 RepID=UPI00232CAD03|nr:hypothetical protein [Halorubrum ezzemoulense]MDB2275530.1 hypothetical protein [Halorubrum ezzemoulense]